MAYRDLADYVFLGEESTYVETPTRPSTPTRPGGVVVYERPKPLHEVPETARPLAVAFDVASVLNAECPWSSMIKARYDALMAGPYLNATQRAQLSAQAKLCVSQARPLDKPTTSPRASAESVLTWTPPTIPETRVVQRPGPSQRPAVIAPPTPFKETGPSVTVTVPSRPVQDVDTTSAIEEREKQRAALEEMAKKQQAEWEKKSKKYQEELARLLAEANAKKQREVSKQQVVETYKVERPQVTKVSEPVSKSVVTLTDAVERFIVQHFKDLLDELKARSGVDLDFEISPFLEFSEGKALSTQADKKLREARRVAEGLRMLGMGVEIYKNVDLSKEVMKRAEAYIKNIKGIKGIGAEMVLTTLRGMIEQTTKEIQNSLFSKYSSSTLGSVADEVTNPHKSEVEQLRNARDIMVPFLKQLKTDFKDIPLEIVNRVEGSIRKYDWWEHAPGVGDPKKAPSYDLYLLQRERQRIVAELAKRTSYYNQVRVSDEFEAREVLREVNSLKKQMEVLNRKIAAPVTVTWAESKAVSQVASVVTEMFNKGQASGGWGQ
jgi:hypothetical protein